MLCGASALFSCTNACIRTVLGAVSIEFTTRSFRIAPTDIFDVIEEDFFSNVVPSVLNL